MISVAVVYRCIFVLVDLLCFKCIEGLYILISVNCNNEVLASVSRLIVWLHKSPSIFNLGLLVFLNWDSLILDRDSWFFTRWVPGLTITICNKITVHVYSLYPTIILLNTCITNPERVLAAPGGPWRVTFAFRWLANLTFFIQIKCWAT